MSWEEQEEKLNKLQQNTQHLLKEARDKSRGWESHPAPESVELASKKVNTGNETCGLMLRSVISKRCCEGKE